MTDRQRRRVGILISGRGSNMTSLIEAARQPDYPAEIALVVSNRPEAGGLARAGAFGIETVALDHRRFPNRASFDAALQETLTAHNIDFVCLAGFMRILTDEFVARWSGRMINIHPSLLPAHKGLDTHARALAAGDKEHGCSVHFVVPELDSGPVIAQAGVPVLPGDTEAALASRVLAEEHRLYPEALRLVASGEVRLEAGGEGRPAMNGFFDGFTLTHIEIPGGALRVRIGGSGPPLLLLHGNPQTHVMWHRVAPRLAGRFTCICPDLRGYGASFKPPATADHAPYAKVEMARDMADLMTRLGHPSFRVASHDRGSRVAHRLALDNPERVEKLAVMDIVPTIEHFERTDMNFALGYYHWFWFAQPHPFPESLIDAAPELWWRAHTARGGELPAFFAPEALADYLTAARDPDAIRGMCEDYRAAATIDLDHDRASREAGVKVRCPMLALWGAKGLVGSWYDPLAIWRHYCAADVTGGSVPSGHYLAEEAPDEVTAALERFLG